MIYDSDFNMPLGGAQVSIVESGAKANSTDAGNYVFEQVAPGNYTLTFTKESYNRQVKANVVVTPGKMTELDASLAGEFTEMDEFIVQDMQMGSGTEAGLLELRLKSPALMDSISSELMSKAGASDAASALRLVSGATVQDGKYAVIRGLPDRYVNTQLNGVRLPTADTNKRAVDLDQYPTAAIESIQVSKTFTPDQQGDASGGAVNVKLKGIPDETMVKFSGQVGYKTQVTGNKDFITYKGGGVGFLGQDKRNIPTGDFGNSWDGAVGTSPGDAPYDYKWSLAAGGKHEFDNGIKVGGLASIFYERNNAFYDDGKDDKYWVEKPGAPMTPQYNQGTPQQGDFKTSLFDVSRSVQQVKWGGLATVGAQTENHSLALTYFYSHIADDVATLAEDTRGKAYFFPGYNPNDPKDPGNRQREAAPYLRNETLEYTERQTQTVQLNGTHKLPISEYHLGPHITTLKPELDWYIAHSSADMSQPDKRQFGELWWAESYNPGYPPYIPPSDYPSVHRPIKPADNFALGNLQRIWKDISETSDQYAWNLKVPFQQWTDDKGFLKFGMFNDSVTRQYNQDSFSNFNDNSAQYYGKWEDHWSAHFPFENHPVTPADIDVDYQGKQKISAYYAMADVPITSKFKVIGGARYEKTELGIVNTPEKDVVWLPPGASGPVTLNPGDADVAFKQADVLPAAEISYKPIEKVEIRAAYSQTVARQTFKELTPIQQQEYLGGEVFIGNPSLQMSSLKNYDLRMDYTPYEGGLVSISYFYKDITNPIEYVQRIVDFPFTTAVNYPKGKLSGYEFEARQRMGQFWDRLEGLSLGGNLTLINSEVTLPADEAAQFDQENIQAPTRSRAMTNAPKYLYNINMTYEMDKLGLAGTSLNLFYTVRGDTLIAGAGQSKGYYIPDVYEKQFGTLNLNLSKKLGKNGAVIFQAKNLLNPKIDTIYRSKYIGEDVTKTSHRNGMEFTLGFTYTF